MDTSTLEALQAALRLSPDNLALRFVVVNGWLEAGRPATALELLAGVGPAGLDGEQRRTAARAALAAGAHEQVLSFADPSDPAGQLLRARAFLALDRHGEGLAAYEDAVAKSPALEDPSLRAALNVSNVRSFPGGRPALKVYANDDTDQSEIRRLLVPEPDKVKFADVGGLEAVKEQIRRKIILPFQKPSLFQRFKKSVGGGILLYGPPGCGKTLLARATAGECNATFFNVAINDVLDMYIGESEAKLHALFEKARASHPAVLFFDEIEALGGKRQYTREASSSKLVSQFLAEMDGFSRNNGGVLVIGATNVPWAVDPAFRRPGRFDRLVFIPPPDRPARLDILRLLLEDRPKAAKIDLEFLAERSSGFSGADLKNLAETAADIAIAASIDAGQEVPIDDSHLRAALREVRATTSEWLTTARNYARYANEGGQYDDVLAFLNANSQ